ncbi:MAG: hypothetical protein ABIJ40_03325 [Bacteroidota bacterium]
MEKYLKLNDVMEEIDRLIRTKQIDLIHIDYEKMKNNFTRMSKSNSFNLIAIPKIVEEIIVLQKSGLVIFKHNEFDIFIGSINPIYRKKEYEIAKGIITKINNNFST